jgi:hypothetical protein
VSDDSWIPLFTSSFKDAQILDPAFCMTFDHCKLCDTHVDPADQRDHLREHRTQLKKFRAQQHRMKQQSAARARKARSS